MTRNISTSVEFGSIWMPKVWRIPNSTAAQKAPKMLPMPPTTTTTNAAARILKSISRSAPPLGI